MTRLFYFLYSWLIFVPLMAATTLVCGAICLALVPFLPADRVARYSAVPWARLCLLYSGVRVDQFGHHNLQPGQSYVIVANHLSQFDIFVLYGYLGVDFRWVMKHELRKVPVIGICCEKLGHIFINRSDRDAAIASLNEARVRLSHGASVLFFPEGTRSRDGQLKPFKKGAFKMAQELQLPVLPVTLTGTFDILPPGTARLQPGHQATLTLHAPQPIPRNEEDVDRLMKTCHVLVAQPLTHACPQALV
ncbi:MAG: 1-acyl-sn-glycerol-3-phosphate acyltransferase [Alcanivoracaceae bacterium]|nr:1-acyl-sn-glycerol-3-phosphate acyltransferase [Alcanivoracaceae bacterium]|tara:strand:+ start:5767 stop:6510 length:744 start_codon:yes stop_codon:yes gene_type:complete